MARVSKAEADKQLVNYVKELRRNHLTETAPDRQRWELAARLFAGDQDWGSFREANPWMAKVFQHEFSVLIRRASSALKGMIFQGRDLFSLLSSDGETEFKRIIEKVLRHYVAASGLEKKFTEYLLAGGIYGIATWRVTARAKPVWKPEYVIKEIQAQEQKLLSSLPKDIERPSIIASTDDGLLEDELVSAFDRLLGTSTDFRRVVEPKKYLEFGVDLRLVNPFNFCWLPGIIDINESPYTVETSFPKFFQLAPLFNSGALDKNKMEEVRKKAGKSMSLDGPNLSSSYEGQRIILQEQLSSTDLYTPVVETLEFFGPVLDKDGKLIDECRHIIIANEVVVKNERNGYWHQRPPYFTTTFSKQPFKDTGQGVADNAIDQQLLVNELTSLWVDMIYKEVLGAHAVKVDGLDDESQIENGIRPGEVIKVTDNPKDIISPISFNNHVTAELFQGIEALKLGGQKGAGVDVSSSNPSSRARISASEINSNSSRSQESVNNLADTIDMEGIQPVVKTIMGLVLQFGLSTENLKLLMQQGVITESEFELLDNIDPIARYNEADRAYRIEIKGFKGVLERGEFLQRAAEFLAQVNQTPEARGAIQFKELFVQMAEAYGLDTDKIIVQNSPQDKAREENMLLANDQLISVGENDADALELPVHYELAAQNPTQAAIAHIQGHLQRIFDSGGQPPPPPPELGKLLFPQQTEPTGEYIQ